MHWHGLPARHVRQPGRADDVACRVDAGDAGLVGVIGLQVATRVLLELDAARQHRRDTDGDQQHVGFDGFLRALVVLDRQPHAAGGGLALEGFGDARLQADRVLDDLGFLDLGAGENLHALFGENS